MTASTLVKVWQSDKWHLTCTKFGCSVDDQCTVQLLVPSAADDLQLEAKQTPRPLWQTSVTLVEDVDEEYLKNSNKDEHEILHALK